MNSDAMLSVVALLGWLIMVGAGIMRRGEPIGKLLAQAAIWTGIIGLLWAAVILLLPATR